MTTAADYTSVRFLEPFLNACDAPTLLAASAVCKAWVAPTTAQRKTLGNSFRVSRAQIANRSAAVFATSAPSSKGENAILRRAM